MQTGWNYLKRVLSRDGMPARLVLLVALAMASALFEGVGVGCLMPIIESLGVPTHVNIGESGFSRVLSQAFGLIGVPFTLPFVLAVALGLFICQSLLAYWRIMLAARTQNKLVVELRTKAFDNLMDFDLAFFHKSRIGELVNTLTTESYRAGYALRAMVEMLAALCILIVYAVVELIISWRLALVAFPVLGAIAVLLRPRNSYQLGVLQSRENENLQTTAVESLGGIREIKSLGIAELIRQRFCQAAQALSLLDVSLWKQGARFTMVYQSSLLAIIVGLFYFGSRSAGLSLASLLVFLIILQRMAPRAGTVTEQRHWWLGYANAMEKVEAMVELTAASKAAVTSGLLPFARLEHGIEVRNVRFRHHGQLTDTLAGVSFSIPRGKMVAIVGSSGAGKSTMLDLLARFYDPMDGCIFVDGHDLREFNLVSWRRAIGLVSQDSFLFNDTIENNIRYGNLAASKEAIVEAARQAYAHHFIVGFPDSYHTLVGDRGVRLSGGQRQRIALARAILKRPQLLILDEATSDLDSESEVYIQQAIREMGKSCTVVVVAHRLSTVEHADVIIVLENGSVVEQGSYEELLAYGGRFAKFHELQFKGFSSPFGKVSSS